MSSAVVSSMYLTCPYLGSFCEGPVANFSSRRSEGHGMGVVSAPVVFLGVKFRVVQGLGFRV